MKSDIDYELIGNLVKSDSDNRESLSGQIAIILRYLIATNAIKPGEALPSLRVGAEALRVNMHTLRNAYHNLDRDGYIEVIPSTGVRARDFAKKTTCPLTTGRLDSFLNEVEAEAKNRFGLDASDLAHLFLARKKVSVKSPVTFVECSLGQASMHAEQVEKIIGRPCKPLVFEKHTPPPDGFCVTTLFHLNEIEQTWPGSADNMHYVHINISDRMPALIEKAAYQGRQIYIGEFDSALGKRIATELARASNQKEELFTFRRIRNSSDVVLSDDNDTIFIAPRVWAHLSEGMKARHNTKQIEYDIETDDASLLAKDYRQYERTLEAENSLMTPTHN
ncbi:MAG: GntR family transcriptional regulator [Pseudomonadota bacterium]